MTEHAQAQPLSYSVRFRVLGKYLGQLALLLAVLHCVPLAVALATGDLDAAWRIALNVVVLSGPGYLLSGLRAPRRIQDNEALVVTGLMFIVGPALAAFPLTAAGLSPMDAIFEAVSGVTTTGLTTVSTVEDKPASFLFFRAWMQWYGGLGIVVLSLALVMRPSMAARRLSAVDGQEDDLVGGTRAHARHVLWVYLALTGGGLVLLLAVGTEPFAALLHTLAAVSTGGYSHHDHSLAGLGSWPATAGVTLLCIAGAVSLTLYYRAAGRRWRDLVTDVELHLLLVGGLVVAAMVLLVLRLTTDLALGPAMGHALTLGFSAQTTAGFSSTNVSSLHPAAKLVLIVAMFIGGGLGSTAGGIKLLRLLILFRVLHVLFQRTALARHAVLEPRIRGRRIEPFEAVDALCVIALYAGVVVLSWIPFLAAGHEPLDALFEVVSATGTVGLSAGVTGPELSPLLKAVLCFDMLAGRLEVIALLVILYPRTWFGKRRQER